MTLDSIRNQYQIRIAELEADLGVNGRKSRRQPKVSLHSVAAPAPDFTKSADPEKEENLPEENLPARQALCTERQTNQPLEVGARTLGSNEALEVALHHAQVP